MPSTEPAAAVNYLPLFGDVSDADVRVFRDRMRASGRSPLTIPMIASFVIAAIVFGMFGIALLAFFVRTVSSAAVGDVDIEAVLVVVIVLAVMVGGGFFAVRAFFGIARWRTWFRLDAFATANGMTYSPRSGAPAYPGAIFGIGSSRTAHDQLTATTPRFIDMGRYTYTTGSGKNRSTHDWGYLAMRLDRALPHMVLDSKKNNGLFGASTLPVSFDRDQVLSLEGDFNEHFTLYCPREYERDALYIFTPDLMALLIDEAAGWDVEIVDDWMFAFSPTPFNPVDPAAYRRLFNIVNTVGRKTLSQSDRYVDERVGQFSANFIAPRGQRLRRGSSAIAITVLVVLSGFVFWAFTGGLLGR